MLTGRETQTVTSLTAGKAAGFGYWIASGQVMSDEMKQSIGIVVDIGVGFINVGSGGTAAARNASRLTRITKIANTLDEFSDVSKIKKSPDVVRKCLANSSDAPNKGLLDLFANRLRYRFVGNAAQKQRYLDDLAELRHSYGEITPTDEVGIVNGRIACGSFDPATRRISILRGGNDLTEMEELLHWKFHNERLANSGWSQADFLRRWNDPNDAARAAFRRQYHDAAEAEIKRIFRDIYGWVPR